MLYGVTIICFFFQTSTFPFYCKYYLVNNISKSKFKPSVFESFNFVHQYGQLVHDNVLRRYYRDNGEFKINVINIDPSTYFINCKNVSRLINTRPNIKCYNIVYFYKTIFEDDCSKNILIITDKLY